MEKMGSRITRPLTILKDLLSKVRRDNRLDSTATHYQRHKHASYNLYRLKPSQTEQIGNDQILNEMASRQGRYM